MNLNGPTNETKCASFCLFNECTAMHVSHFEFKLGDTEIIETHCFISLADPFDGDGNHLSCFGTTCDDPSNEMRTNVFGIFRDNAVNPENLPSQTPDGSYQVIQEDIDGSCGTNSDTVFGDVAYRQTSNYEFDTDSEKKLLSEVVSDINNCAALCFEKAGCSFFYTKENICNMIIGTSTNIVENNNIGISGLLTNVCPNPAFTNDYNRRSEFYCKFEK